MAAIDLPADFFTGYPMTDGGLPILQHSNFSGGEVLAVFDATLDDPIARWGQCLERVTACARANEGRLKGCVQFIEVCDDPRGGTHCCPSRCVESLQAALEATSDEVLALKQSVLTGDCVEGFAEQNADLSEVSP